MTDISTYGTPKMQEINKKILDLCIQLRRLRKEYFKLQESYIQTLDLKENQPDAATPVRPISTNHASLAASDELRKSPFSHRNLKEDRCDSSRD